MCANAQFIGAFYEGDPDAWFDKEPFFACQNNYVYYGYGQDLQNITVVINGTDVYSFPSILGDIDEYLFAEGNHLDLYKKLQRENIACKLLIIVNNDILNSEQSEFVDSLRSVTSTDLNVLWVVHEKFELMPIFKYARVYVRPTKTDGDSLSVREALAMGCAVVTSDKAKRPSGALVYHTAEEFFGMTKDVLLNGAELSNKVKSENFYNQIKEQYELG